MSDMVCILNVKLITAQSFVWTLRKIGYVKLVKKPTPKPKDWIYRCIKHTGFYSPSISGQNIFDHNTEESFVIPKQNSKEKLYRAVLTIEKSPFSVDDVLEASEKTTKRRVVIVLNALRKKEVVILDSIGKQGVHYYVINKEYRNLIQKESL